MLLSKNNQDKAEVPHITTGDVVCVCVFMNVKSIFGELCRSDWQCCRAHQRVQISTLKHSRLWHFQLLSTCDKYRLPKHFKGIVHSKIKILSLFTHPQVVPNLYECLCSAENEGRYSEECEKQSSSGAPLTSIVFFVLLWKSMVPQNSLVTNFLQNIFLCVWQNKDIHTGLELLEGE